MTSKGPSPDYEAKLKRRVYDDVTIERRRQERLMHASRRQEERSKEVYHQWDSRMSVFESEADSSNALSSCIPRGQSQTQVENITDASDAVRSRIPETHHNVNLVMGDLSHAQGTHPHIGIMQDGEQETRATSGDSCPNGYFTQKLQSTFRVVAPSLGDPDVEIAFQNLRKDILDPLYEACTFDEKTNEWIVPREETRLKIDRFYWHQTLGKAFPHDITITSCIAKFFRLECDPNRSCKPRLDIVLSFSESPGGMGFHEAKSFGDIQEPYSTISNGCLSVRYHPAAKLIWSNEAQPTAAMQARLNLARKRNAN